MNNAIANLFSGQVANAVSRTLIHSLWQGALLSVVTGLVMACTRKASSPIRYNLLVAAMALFAVAVAGTFCFEFSNGDAHMPASTGQHVVNTVPILSEKMIYTTSPSPSIWETISFYLNTYASIIACTWLLIVCARCLQLVTGLREIYRLRHKNRSGIGSYWEEQVRQLSDQLGIKRLVGIAQSARAKAPMVTGHLKPLILIPIGMFTSLSTEEAEAVLLHELAHIRRSDYLVNLLQSIMEIIFFFNPAILWLSALIKAERENCCDDMAVARSGKVNYLKALVACEEYNMPAVCYAMALKVNNGSLKNRVTRIISNKNLPLNKGEKSLLAVCLIAVGIFATAFADGGKAGKKAMAGQKDAAMQPMADSIPGAGEDTVFAKQVTDTTRKHTNAAAKDTGSVFAGSGHATNEQKTDEAKPKSDSDWTQAYQNKHPGPYDAYLQDRSKQIAYELLKENLVKDKTYFTYRLSRDEFSIDGIKQPDVLRRRIVDEFFKPDDDFNIGYTFKDPGIYGASKSIYNKSSTDYQGQSYGQQRKIIDEMAREGLINYRDDVSFTLTTKTLVINGIVQSGEIFQRYRQDYVPADADDSWTWNYNGPGSYPANAYRSRDWDAYSRQTAAERQRVEAERDKKLVADLLQDGLITDPNNVTFTLSDKKIEINGKKQSEELYNKYKDKYMHNNTGGTWGWNYQHHG